MCPKVTSSGEAAQMPASSTSKQRLGREARAALLRVMTRTIPQGQSVGTNLREQTRLWDSYPAKSPNLRH